jgi:hypothetical protein
MPESATETASHYAVDSIAWGAFTITAVIQTATAGSFVHAIIGITPAMIGAYIWMRHQKDRENYERMKLDNERTRIQLEHERELRKIDLGMRDQDKPCQAIESILKAAKNSPSDEPTVDLK